MKNTKVTKASRERLESGRTKVVDQKEKLQQQEAAPKRPEKTRMAARKCATEKKFRHLCRTKGIVVLLFKQQKTGEEETVELTTFRPETSSGKRNERQYVKAHEFMKKKR